MNRWTRQEIHDWRAAQPWPCGFNYIPANAISYTEMWMPYCYDAKLIDRELALAEAVGFNCLRVVLPFVVWEHDPRAFVERLDDFLRVCAGRGIKVMFTLFDDCVSADNEKLKDPWYGQQPEVLPGWYANGWTPSPGHSMVRDPRTWPRLRAYVQDVIGAFKTDPRAWVWDLYNEPTNGGLGDASLPLVKEVFAWARQVTPDQPLTVGLWNQNAALNEIIFANSDLITFHDYRGAEKLAAHVEDLKRQDRPMVCTEWLCRHQGSTVAACLPVFRRNNVGCLHWGLVNGKTQTHLAWGARPGKPAPAVWQHDLFHGDHTPYDEAELVLFRQTIAQDSTRWA